MNTSRTDFFRFLVERAVCRRLFATIGIAIGLLLGACDAPGVGDPCNPEQVPSDGYKGSEAYVETSSVQCRTRVCLVYHFEGDPATADQNQVRDHIYCTCRCKTTGGDSTTTCDCPSGFACSEILKLGGAGVEGFYCVKKSTLEAEQSK